MFDTSSSEDLEIDDKSRDSDDESNDDMCERTRNDPPSACPKHFLITPHLNEKKRKREKINDQSSFSSSSRNEKRIRKDLGIIKQSPRNIMGSASDRSMTSKKSSSSRRAKSRTVTAPTPDVIDYIESMSIVKLRKNIRSGQRVKVSILGHCNDH